MYFIEKNQIPKIPLDFQPKPNWPIKSFEEDWDVLIFSKRNYRGFRVLYSYSVIGVLNI